MMNKKKTFRLIQLSTLFSLLVFFILISCSKDTKTDTKSLKVDTLKVYCDEAIYNLMEPNCNEYDSINTKIHIELIKSTAFEAMAKILAGEADISFISREYTRREDSLMKLNNVKPRLQKTLANDALVFFVYFENKLDSLNDEQIKNVITGDNTLCSYFPKKLKSEPTFAIADKYSSEYENFLKFIVKGNKIKIPLKLLPNTDSVKQFVLNNKNSIGIGYFSQVVKEPDLKALPIGFIDSTGKYIFPHVVHQANILQRFYPYIVNHYIYVLDENNPNSLEFLRYLRNPQGKVQRFFLEAGIVPAVGDFKLRPLYE